MKFLISTLVLLFQFTLCISQEHSENIRPNNRISALMGYVIVPSEVDNSGNSEFRAIPTFGLDYERRINSKWGVGWFNDIELSAYFINNPNSEDLLKREFAFISALCLMYTPIHRLTFYAGPGYEFEKHENFFVFRLGTEYEIPLENKNWDASFGLCFDHKEVYNSIGFTIAFGRWF